MPDPSHPLNCICSALWDCGCHIYAIRVKIKITKPNFQLHTHTHTQLLNTKKKTMSKCTRARHTLFKSKLNSLWKMELYALARFFLASFLKMEWSCRKNSISNQNLLIRHHKDVCAISDRRAIEKERESELMWVNFSFLAIASKREREKNWPPLGLLMIWQNYKIIWMSKWMNEMNSCSSFWLRDSFMNPSIYGVKNKSCKNPAKSANWMRQHKNVDKRQNQTEKLYLTSRPQNLATNNQNRSRLFTRLKWIETELRKKLRTKWKWNGKFKSRR